MNGVSDPDNESPLRFPCAFPIKVMGRHEGDFEARVVEMIRGHAGAIPVDSVRSRPSRNGRYLAVTVTINAESREQLDNVYRTLTAAREVLFVL